MRLTSRAFVLGVVLASSMLAACGGQDRAGAGQVSILLSSSGATSQSLGAAPQDVVATAEDTGHDHCAAPQAASVTFSSILARTLDGKLVDVTIDLPVTTDLLALVNGKESTLPAGFLPPGTYDQFVVVMTKLELTLASGTKIAVTPPGGGWTAVVPVSPPFTVVAGQTTTVGLKFRRDLSFGCNLDEWEFHPAFEGRHTDD